MPHLTLYIKHFNNTSMPFTSSKLTFPFNTTQKHNCLTQLQTLMSHGHYTGITKHSSNSLNTYTTIFITTQSQYQNPKHHHNITITTTTYYANFHATYHQLHRNTITTIIIFSTTTTQKPQYIKQQSLRSLPLKFLPPSSSFHPLP